MYDDLDELLEEAYLEGYYDSMDDMDDYYESNSATRDLIQQHEKGHADDYYRTRGLMQQHERMHKDDYYRDAQRRQAMHRALVTDPMKAHAYDLWKRKRKEMINK